MTPRAYCQVRDDGQDSGVGSVDDGHPRDESPERANKPTPPYPQFEDDSGELLKPSNPAYPTVSPSAPCGNEDTSAYGN